MGTVIASVIFLGSLAGLLYIIGRKLPELRAVSDQEGKSVEELKETAKEWFRRRQYVRSPETLLQKILSQARIASLKAEAKTSRWLEKLRKRAQEKKNGNGGPPPSDGYWRKLKGKGKGKKGL